MTGAAEPGQRAGGRPGAAPEAAPGRRTGRRRPGIGGPAARTAVGHVLERASGPQSAVRELLGEPALWWNCCGEALRDDPAWLAGRDCEELRGWLRATAPDRDHEPATTARVEHPLLLARALTVPGEDTGEQDGALLRLLGAWENSGLLCPGTASGPPQPAGKDLAVLSPRLAGATDALLQRIQRLRPAEAAGGPSSAAAALLVIAALMMAGLAPRRRPVVRVPVVFGRSSRPGAGAPAAEGATGVLELREFAAGPAGLYPDPRTMDGVRSGNGQFAAALGDAWRLAGPQREGRCVVWRIVLSDEPAAPDRIEGPSLGAAFALGLRALLRRRPGVARLRDVFYGLRPRTAVTGALDADGRLLRVAGLDAKLLAVRRKGFRLVAPEANRLEVSAAAPRPGEVRFAATLREADRHARQFRTGRVAVSALVLAAVTAGVFALHQRDLAAVRQQSALASQVAGRADQVRATDSSLAARMDVAAYRLVPTGDRHTRLVEDANQPLSTVLSDFSGSVHTVAFSPDGRTLATVATAEPTTRTLRLWDMADRAHPVPLGEPVRVLSSTGTVAFSPDGRTLATAGVSTNNSVQLWDVTDRTRPRRLGAPLPDTPMGPLRFSPDGRILATGSKHVEDEQLWDVTDPAHPGRQGPPLPHTTAVNTVAFSPDGRTLATSSVEDGVRLWNLADPARATPLGRIWDSVGSLTFGPDGRTLAVTDRGSVQLLDVADPAHVVAVGGALTGSARARGPAVFSPDGRLLAAAFADHTVRLWNTANPGLPTSLAPPMAGHTDTVSSMAFGPDGRTLATSSADHTVRLWHLPAAVLSDHTDLVTEMRLGAGGRLLVTASVDRTVRLWNTADPARPLPLGRVEGFTDPVGSVALSPDGRTLVTAIFSENRVVLWNVADPTRPAAVGQIARFPTGVTVVEFSPDGRTLATVTSSGIVGAEKSVRLWDVSDPARPRQRALLPSGAVSVGGTVAFSPDGRTLAASGSYAGETTQLWDVTDPDRPAPSGPALAKGFRSMSFSPDGRTLVTVTDTGHTDTPGDGAIELWDVSDRTRPTLLGPPLAGYTGRRVRAVAFSPDGRALATAGAQVRLWDVTNPAHPAAIGRTLAISTEEITSLAFTPDGRTVVTGGYDHLVRLWPWGAEQSVERVCANTGTPTPAQWQRYLSALPYRDGCG
ncbi:WD40 repeat domain-containing protein [Kitasatospora sp. NPDC058115]|uniref:WD40 repeat domain-containing protein n=1 Tax=Kitasatospora sp. NPDC058115 TaxID=3346347 RepID=UPI0036DB53BE